MSNSKSPKQGLFICLYGPSKGGKTVASAAAGVQGVFLGDPSGLLSAKRFLGIEKLRIFPAKTLPELQEKLKMLKPGIASVVVDDFSLIVETTINEYEKTKGRSGMWSALTRDVLQVRDAARELTASGTLVIFNCHEQPPRTSSGKFIRGGPALPGQLPEKFSGMVDVIGRVVFEESAAPWKYQIQFGPQPDYVSGDRLAIFPETSPMNLAEGLRAAGMNIPFPKELSWAEGAVEQLSKKILKEGIEEWRDVFSAAVPQMKAKYPIAHVRWVLQDALHRAIIHHHSVEKVLSAFTEDGEESPF